MGRAEQAGWLVGWWDKTVEHVSGFLSYISHDFASKATAPSSPQHQAAHQGVGQTLQAIHNNGTLRARPCRTKKPGIQLMRLNAGRAGGVWESFSRSTILR